MKFLKSLALVVAAGLIITGCGGGNTPSAVAKKWMDACKNFDPASAKKYVSNDFQAKYDEAIEAMEAPETKANLELAKSFMKDLKFNVSDEKIDGDVATVSITVSFMGQEDSQVVYLKKEDGTWKVNQAPLNPGGDK